MNFETSKEDANLILEIALQAHELAKAIGREYPVFDAMMDVTATHCNGCPLKLQDLRDAPISEFGHDVYGIRANLNRDTGTLENCFLPRFANLS